MDSFKRVLVGFLRVEAERIRSSLRLQVEAEMVLIHIVRLHGVNDTSSYSQRPPVKDPERCFLVDL